MKIDENIRTELLPELIEICLKLGISVIDMDKVYPMCSPFYAGLYHHDYDHIAISPINCKAYNQDINLVLLHEIGHWTGAKYRYERIGIALKGSKEFSGIAENEEVIAQYFMFEMSKKLKLDFEKSYRDLISYLKRIGTNLVNYKECRRQSTNSINWLLNEIKSKSESMAA